MCHVMYMYYYFSQDCSADGVQCAGGSYHWSRRDEDQQHSGDWAWTSRDLHSTVHEHCTMYLNYIIEVVATGCDVLYTFVLLREYVTDNISLLLSLLRS